MIAYKVVKREDESSCSWAIKPSSPLYTVYHDGDTLVALPKTLGFFVFKELKDAANFIRHNHFWKIKKVVATNPRRLKRPCVCGVYTLLKVRLNEYKRWLKERSKTPVPAGTYVCRVLTVLGDVE